MSSAFSLPRSAIAGRHQQPAWASPMLWQFLPMLGITLLGAVIVPSYIYYRQGAVTHQRQTDLSTLIAKMSVSDGLTDEQIAVLATLSVSGGDSLTADLTRAREEYEGAQQQLIALHHKASERISSVAMTRAETSRQRSKALRVKDGLKELAAESERWQSECGSVLTNDAGRRIAASAEHLERVLPVLHQDPFDQREIEGWNDAFEDLITPLEHAFEHNSGDAVFSDAHLAQIASIGESVQKALDSLRRARLVVTTAVAETSSYSPAVNTLDDIIELRKIADARRVEELVEQARQAERARQIALLQKAEQEQIALEEQLKIQEVNKVSADLKRKLDAFVESWKANAQREKERQIAQAENDLRVAMPEIRRYLPAFTSAGRSYRNDRSVGPVSLSRIQSTGALQPTLDGCIKLTNLLANNDRQRGPLPACRSQLTAAEYEVCKKAQQLLNQFGPMLVKKGMLAE